MRGLIPAIGTVTAITALGALLCGCVNMSGRYTVTNDMGNNTRTVEVEITKRALFWPSSVESAKLVLPTDNTNATPATLEFSGFKSTGGAAELAPLLDSAGKFIGYVVK